MTKKTYKSSDIVLGYEKKGVKIVVTAGNFNLHNFDGVTVSGEDYYVAKAVKAGAKKG